MDARPLRIYVAGPMTGIELLNFPAFHGAARKLRGLGLEVINPAEINTDPAAEWADCMRADIAQLMTCDGVALLPGWERSRGACLEQLIAEQLGMPSFPVDDLVRELALDACIREMETWALSVEDLEEPIEVPEVVERVTEVEPEASVQPICDPEPAPTIQLVSEPPSRAERAGTAAARWNPLPQIPAGKHPYPKRDRAR